MRDILAFLQDVDVGNSTLRVGQLIASAEPWFLWIVVLALVALGHKMAVGHRIAYGWGLRLAALTFLGHGGYVLVQAGGFDEGVSSSMFAGSAIIAGAVLALVWILLPVLLFVYGNFRYGLAGFLGYLGYGLFTAETFGKEVLPGIVLKGLLAAGLAMILAWILRPIWEFVAALWQAQFSSLRERAKAAGKVGDESRLSRRERRQRRRTRLQALRVQAAADAAASATASIARTMPIAALAHGESESRRQRDKARLEAELAYLLAFPQIGHTFSREMFDGWVNRYLGNHLPAEEVEENSWALKKALSQHQQPAESGNAHFNLEDLHAWFIDEQRRIQALHLDPPIRQAKLLGLQELYVSLSQRFIGEPPTAVVQMIGPRAKELLTDNVSYPEPVSASS